MQKSKGINEKLVEIIVVIDKSSTRAFVYCRRSLTLSWNLIIIGNSFKLIYSCTCFQDGIFPVNGKSFLCTYSSYNINNNDNNIKSKITLVLLDIQIWYCDQIGSGIFAS